jgi:hypothetical protein
VAGEQQAELAQIEIKTDGTTHRVVVNGTDIAPYLNAYRFSASSENRLGLLQIELGGARLDFDGQGVVEVIEDLYGWLDRLDGDILTEATLRKQTESMSGSMSFGQAALAVLKDWARGD